MTPRLLREAAAPLLLIGDIHLAAGAAAYTATGTWAAPAAGPALLADLLRGGPAAVLGVRSNVAVFIGVLAAAVVAEPRQRSGPAS